MGYTLEEKTIAIAAIQRSGGLTNQAIHEIRQMLDKPTLSKSTIHGWLKGYQASSSVSSASSAESEPNRRTEPNFKKRLLPEPQEVNEAQEALDEMFEGVARTYLEKATEEDRMAKMSGKDFVMAAAIAVDKMRLLRNLPTEIVQVLPSLVDALKANNIDPAQFFNSTLNRLNNVHGGFTQ